MLALGNFDGLHRGHVKIIERVNRRAGERGATSVVMTFDPHPPRVVRPDKAPPLLMTKAQRLEAIAAAGIQGTAVVRFTHELSQWDPETFVRTVLVEWLHVAEVWVGANFLFGRDRAGNFSMLRTLGARYGFRAEKIDPVRYREFVVSSTRIRRLISEGPRRRGRGAARAPVCDRRHRRRRRAARPRARVPDGEPRDRERAGPAARRLRDDRAARVGDSPRDHEHRRASDVRRRRAHDRSRRTCSGSSGTCTARRCASGSCSGSGTSARSTASSSCARRSRPTGSGRVLSSSACRCRISRADGARYLPVHDCPCLQTPICCRCFARCPGTWRATSGCPTTRRGRPARCSSGRVAEASEASPGADARSDPGDLRAPAHRVAR